MFSICMGGDSRHQRELKEISKQIDRDLKTAKKKLKSEKKLLLLGTGEAGKTTFIKQMRIIHGKGYSDSDKLDFKSLVYQNVYSAISTLGDAMDKLELFYSDPLEVNLLEELMEVINCVDQIESIPEHHIAAIKKFWADAGVQECYRARNKFQLNDSAHYFLGDIDRIATPNYIPEIDDILRTRKATTGIQEYPFQIDNIIFRMVDVGGQKSERRKWIHCFEGVDAVMYLTAISEYDQFLAEDDETNRLEESLNLFNTIIQYPWFVNSPIIVFMNKIDLLEEKIEHSDINDTWPDYTGPTKNFVSARDFIFGMFQMIWLEYRENMYHHFTQATDTKNVRVVFDVVKNDVLLRNIQEVIPGFASNPNN